MCGHFFRGVVLGSLTAALVLGASTALAGTGVGGLFNLGRSNSVNATSALTGTTGGPQLSVANGGGAGVLGRSGVAGAAGVYGYNSAGGPGLQAYVTSNAVAPLKVNSRALVANLNANFLGGHAGTYFLATTGTAANSSELGGLPANLFYRWRTSPSRNTITTLDSTGNVGETTSATIGSDGLGLISYYDATNGNLKVAHCSNLACTSATVSTLDSTGNVGSYTALAIGSDGRGVISYYDVTNTHLKVAHCANVACTSATTTTVDNGGGVGLYSSIAIGTDGFPLISYEDGTNHNLKVAHCANVACTSSNTYTIDSSGTVNGYTSIAVGADGRGLISFSTTGGVGIDHCFDVACSGLSSSVVVSASGAAFPNSITIGADGLGIVSYYAFVSMVGYVFETAHCGDVLCSNFNGSQGIDDSSADVGAYNSLTIGPDGLGVASYYDGQNGDLRVAHCLDGACSFGTASTIDSSGDVGRYTSMTIGADGLPLISYYDATNGNLKVAHCANPFCVGYFRRR